MHRSHSSVPYDILHGIDFSSNISSIFAYLSYFPPPPPLIPSAPPQRSWTCSARTLSSSSCSVADDLNPPSLRTLISSVHNNNNYNHNQSALSINTSHIDRNINQNFESASILDLFQNQLPFIILLIIFLSIFIFVIILLLTFLCMQRKRQRQLTSSHNETNNNNNNNKFYHRLIPQNKKCEKRNTTSRHTNDTNNLLSETNHDSPAVEVTLLSKPVGTQENDNEEEQEQTV